MRKIAIILVMIMSMISVISLAYAVEIGEDDISDVEILKEIVSSFLRLSDTPSSYTGANDQCVIVNETAGELYFGDCGNATSEGSGGNLTLSDLQWTNNSEEIFTNDGFPENINFTGDIRYWREPEEQPILLGDLHYTDGTYATFGYYSSDILFLNGADFASSQNIVAFNGINSSADIWGNGTDSFSTDNVLRWAYNMSDGIGGGNSSWNQTYADTLYAGIEWAYNQSDGSYNATYDQWAYNQTEAVDVSTINLFDQDLNTTSNVTFHNVTATGNLSVTNNIYGNVLFGILKILASTDTGSDEGYGFINEEDTGLFMDAGGLNPELRIMKDGTDKITIDSTTEDISIEDRLLIQAGTEASPSIYFTGDSDTGIYRVSTNIFGITTGGNQKARFSTTGITTDYNVTADWFKGKINYSDVQNHPPIPTEVPINRTLNTFTCASNRTFTAFGGMSQRHIGCSETPDVSGNPDRGYILTRNGSLVSISVVYDISTSTTAINTGCVNIGRGGAIIDSLCVYLPSQVGTNKLNYTTQMPEIDNFTAGDILTFSVIPGGFLTQVTYENTQWVGEVYYDD